MLLVLLVVFRINFEYEYVVDERGLHRVDGESFSFSR